MKYFFLLFPITLFSQCSGIPSQFPKYELKQPVFRDTSEYFFYYSDAEETRRMEITKPEYPPMWILRIRGEQVNIFSKKPLSSKDCPDCVFVCFAPITAIKYEY